MAKLPSLKPPEPINRTAYKEVLKSLLADSGPIEDQRLRQILDCLASGPRDGDWWLVAFSDLRTCCDISNLTELHELTDLLAERLEAYFWHDPEGQKDVHELMVTPAPVRVRVDFFTKITAKNKEGQYNLLMSRARGQESCS
jgi:hypothetical protein